jgi:MFS transporter, UMF1 family
MFRSLPEVIYLALGCGVAVFVTGSYASSRTLMVRLAPPERAAAFFGLYALSGTVTMWLGSMLVKFATAAFDSQRAGFMPIALLLLAGLAGTAFIRGGGPLERRDA